MRPGLVYDSVVLVVPRVRHVPVVAAVWAVEDADAECPALLRHVRSPFRPAP